MKLLDTNGFIVEDEFSGVKKAPGAITLTYIASMASGISQLLRLILIRNRNNKS